MQIIINSESKYRQIFSSILNRSFLIPLSVFQLRVQNIMNYFYIYTLQHAEIKLQIGGSAFFPTGWKFLLFTRPRIFLHETDQICNSPIQMLSKSVI